MTWIKKQWNRFKKWIIGLFLIPTVFASTGAIIDQQINPYIETATRFEIAKDMGDEGIEKVKFSKDKPKMILGKWNDEVQMGVSYSKVKGKGNKRFLSNKLEWQGVNEKVVAYPLAATTTMENGGYEFEIELASRPSSNIFEFEITGAEQLNFFYQPALTQEEIDEGANRPPEVVGSYAIYHSTKRNHRQGSINYKTGKLFHLYRPLVKDAVGNTTWADLNWVPETQTMQIIIPQEWINTATYPIVF